MCWINILQVLVITYIHTYREGRQGIIIISWEMLIVYASEGTELTIHGVLILYT